MRVLIEETYRPDWWVLLIFRGGISSVQSRGKLDFGERTRGTPYSKPGGRQKPEDPLTILYARIEEH